MHFVQPGFREPGILLFLDIVWSGYEVIVIFLNGMCPLLPDLVVCHSDLPTFSSSFCCCNVNWQTAFLLCLIVSAYYWFQLILYFYLFLALLYLGFSLSFMLPTIVSYLDTPLAAKLKKKKRQHSPKLELR